MGFTVEGVCKCGFRTDHLNLGGGMASHGTVATFPGHCRECQDLILINIYSAPLACGRCGSEGVVCYSRKREQGVASAFDWGDSTLEDKNYPCPKCGVQVMFASPSHRQLARQSTKIDQETRIKYNQTQ